jgi:hypothetical protein
MSIPAVDPVEPGLHLRPGDVEVDPLSDWMIERLLAKGMPPEAIREDRTIDGEVLRASGWGVVSDGVVLGPLVQP